MVPNLAADNEKEQKRDRDYNDLTYFHVLSPETHGPLQPSRARFECNCDRDQSRGHEKKPVVPHERRSFVAGKTAILRGHPRADTGAHE
jgi:hypothetical protein